MAWLTGWSRRKQLYLNGTTAGAQLAYQMKITVNYGPGTDTSGNIFCGNNVKADFSDIRFTDSSGTTLLNYWIESYVLSSSATIWVKIPSIPVGSNSAYIYFYYNNPSAPATGPGTGNDDGVATFQLFDHFLGTTLDTGKWTATACSSYSISGSILTLNIQTCNNSDLEIFSNAAFGNFTAFRTKLSLPWGGCSGSWNYDVFGYATGGHWGSNNVVIAGSGNWTCNALMNFTSAWGAAGIAGDAATHIWEIQRTGSESYAFKDNALAAGPLSAQYPTTSGGVGFQAQIGAAGSIIIDWALVRTYANPEPLWSTIITSEQTISLTINSTPSIARIWLAHPTGTTYVDQGVNTNTTISNLEPGTYDIKLVLAGYTDWILTNQTYTSGQTITINATFAGSAYISSVPTGASVYLDGSPTSLGATPITIGNLTTTTSGATAIHSYRLTSIGCPDATGSFTATAGQTINIPVTFPGNLSISSTPVTGARIWLAHPTGTTYVDQGVNTNITLTKEIGTYDIKLVLTGYQDWISTNNTVNSCTTTNVSATLAVPCGSISCNLIVLSILSEQLSERFPGYLDIDIISIYVDQLINNY